MRQCKARNVSDPDPVRFVRHDPNSRLSSVNASPHAQSCLIHHPTTPIPASSLAQFISTLVDPIHRVPVIQ